MNIVRGHDLNVRADNRRMTMIELREGVDEKETEKRLILVGNPNVGKSVLFHVLTGRYVTVSNYPGTTVEMSVGRMSVDGDRFVVYDTPGINSLLPTSEDEEVTRNIVFEGKADAIVQVADSKNLRRALTISIQLAEMGLSYVLDLNMEDEASSRGIQVDTEKLSEILGVDVVSTVATQREGIEGVIRGISGTKRPGILVRYSDDIEAAIREIEPYLPETNIAKRFLALMLLSGDRSLLPLLKESLGSEERDALDGICRRMEIRYAEPLGSIINQQRARIIERILDQVRTRREPRKSPLVRWIGEWTMHPVWGIPFLVGVLFLMYEFVGVFGAGIVVDILEGFIFGQFINPLAVQLVDFLVPIGIVRDLLIGEYGVITMALTYSVAIVLPVVGTFFIAFGILEDSGYLPRLAVMVDRLFRVIGLNGKAVLPMILGLGCDTMATLTTRILGTRKERILTTLLLALGIPCSAQLGVILGMLAGLSLEATLLWVGIVFFVLLAVGFVASRIVPGERADFILEIPPMRIPQLRNILTKTIARIEWYLKEAVPLFILGTLVLFFLDVSGLLGRLEIWSRPVVERFLGLPAETTQAFIVGFLRRDYGAAGLFVLARDGALDGIQIIVSLVTITLFVPCVANFFIIVKERGVGVALAMMAFIFPFAFVVGGILNIALRNWGWTP
jgi:ferrous iron transport protein B